MRLMIVAMLALAGFGIAFMLSPSLRAEVSDVLLDEQTEAQIDANARQIADKASARLKDTTAGALNRVSTQASQAAQRIAEDVGSPAPQQEPPTPEPTPTQEPPPEPTEPTSSQPAAPETPAPQQRPASPVAARLRLPSMLNGIRFGMTPQQVAACRQIGWRREQGGELMLTHYADPQKVRQVRFHFSAGESLYKIELRRKVGETEDKRQIYDQTRQMYAAEYANLPVSRKTTWSDGTVHAHIEQYREGIQVTFTCQDARR